MKPLGCEADHLFPFNIEVRSEWSYTFTPPYSVTFTFTTPFVVFRVDITQFL